MSYDAALTAIREKDIDKLIKLFFDSTSGKITPSFRAENDLWDYKKQIPQIRSENIEWAELSKDILAFHNTRKVGIILFGVEDKSYSVVGINSKIDIDSKIVNDKIRKYLGDQVRVELYGPLKVGIAYVAVLLIPGLSGSIKRFKNNGPEKNRKPIFVKDGAAIRDGDSSKTLNVEEADELSLKGDALIYGPYKINGQNYQVLNPDYIEFIRREKYCAEIIKGLQKNRVSVVTLTGIGGIGKTSLAVWATEQAYINKDYKYIVSMSAKDRELTAAGIQAIYQGFTTLEDILDNILRVIGFDEMIDKPLAEKEKNVRLLIEGSNMLILLDNLETTTDEKIDAFINDLPDGVKAIVTSRRNIVRVSSYPIEVEGLEDEEIVQFITSLEGSFVSCANLSRSEKISIGEACNRIPLAIKWLVSRCKSSEEILTFANSMESNSKANSELLEFVFRRLFDDMNPVEKRIVQVLAIASDIPDEALLQGCYGIEDNVHNSLEKLVRDTIVIKKFDDDLNWYKYSLLPLTSGFILRNCISSEEDRRIRGRLNSWYQADDILNLDEKILVQNMRQNGKNIGNALVKMANTAQTRGDYDTAVQLFEQAVTRDPRNWRVYKAFAEYYRKIAKNISLAIQYYQKAIEYLPKSDMDSSGAIVRREYAMTYLKSGQKDSLDVAIEQLEIACRMQPSDPIAAKFLGESYMNKGFYQKAIEVFTPFKDTRDPKTQKNIWPLLWNSYEKNPTKYMLEKVEIADKMRKAGIIY